MKDFMKNQLSFSVRGRYALYTDPLSKIGGEKSTYHIPTYEAMKGLAKSIYWKPTFIWVIDRVRIMKKIRTRMDNRKPLDFQFGLTKNTVSIYTILVDVEYQVEAHQTWNLFKDKLKDDRIEEKHYEIAKRKIETGGRLDTYLGTRDCQAYVEPCKFGENIGFYDNKEQMMQFGIMFHSFSYPDENGKTNKYGEQDKMGQYYLHSKFWEANMKNGIIEYPSQENCQFSKLIKPMIPDFKHTTKEQSVGQEI